MDSLYSSSVEWKLLRFLGIDFGWEQPSGVAALDWAGQTLHLATVDRIERPRDVLDWVKPAATDDTAVGIDAPIGGTKLSSSLARLGFRHGDLLAQKAPGRFQIKVRPHLASVQLFALDRVLKYKNGRLAERARELSRLRSLMLEQLPLLEPSLALTALPEIPKGGREVKAVADQLEAVLAAYLAAHWWYWGSERNDVLGNSKLGYIVMPHGRSHESPADSQRPAKETALEEAAMDADPMVQFESWYAQARTAGLEEPNAMTLATVSADGQPSARIVLLKGATPDGFAFYTNYRSRKGRELAANPHAALVFYWPELRRQVRVTGRVERTSRAETEAYFRIRPRGSQLSAWASWQSSVIAGREALERRVEKLESRYAGQDVPTPPGWGGYRLRPETIEFWQGRVNRLHDRLVYSRQPDGRWTMERLAP